MNKNDAKDIIEDVFSNEYDFDRFRRFVDNLLKNYTHTNIVRDLVKESFKSFVHSYKILGSFEDDSSNKIDILEVTLNKSSSLQRARTAQRNFIADYLKTNSKEAALVAFVPRDNSDWRFSLIKLEHSLELRDDKVATKEKITPAKRWSFLIGKYEGSHTAQSRFVSMLVDDEKPNLTELESSFDIEVVTSDFFDEYKELFLIFNPPPLNPRP